LQPPLLLVWQRTDAGERAEVLPEGRRAHVRAVRDVVDPQGLDEVVLEPRD